MKNVNLGIAKGVIKSKLNEDFVKNDNFGVSKTIANEFISLLKESEILTLEFKTYKAIENKNIKTPSLAIKYIEDIAKLFESYSKQEILAEHKKLERFIDEQAAFLDKDKKELYNSINTIICEYSNSNDIPNIDAIHDAIEIITEHLCKEKTSSLNEEKVNSELEIHEEKILSTAVDKFNKKYSSLSEGEKELLKKLIFSNEKEKKDLFESLKSESVSILEETDKNGNEDKVLIAIEKIKKMEYNEDSLIENVVSLNNLKTDLLG